MNHTNLTPTAFNSTKHKEALSLLNMSDSASICLERKPMSDRQIKAWEAFWTSVIDEVKAEIKQGGNNAC